jgi:hypothetical protein
LSAGTAGSGAIFSGAGSGSGDVTMWDLTCDNIAASGKIQPGNVAVSYTANFLTIANNGVAELGTSNFGLAVIHAGGSGIAFYAINGGLHTTQELVDGSGVYSPTAGTASSINVYWSAGNARYEVENKRGATVNLRIWLLDAA